MIHVCKIRDINQIIRNSLVRCMCLSEHVLMNFNADKSAKTCPAFIQVALGFLSMLSVLLLIAGRLVIHSGSK